MLQTIAEIAAHLWELQTSAEVLARCSLEFFNFGAVRFSYHQAPAHHKQTAANANMQSCGFDKEWLRLYNDPAFRSRDPVTDYVMAKGKPMAWRDVLTEQRLSPEQQSFIQTFERYHPIDGIGIPLYGPYCTDGFCTVSIGRPLASSDYQKISDFRRLALAGHTRIAVIEGEKKKAAYALSKREAEVLRLMAKGNSNKEIAQSMKLSPASIDTYVRRIFSKLETNDRVEASLRGVSYGLIKF
jgi:DNA-binding CsgD family transcriptional regulator